MSKWHSSRGLDSQEHTYTQEIFTENRVRQRLCTQKGTPVSKILVMAKPGVYPKGDTFRGILELQLGAVVLELMVLGKLKKGNGSAGAVFEALTFFWA